MFLLTKLRLRASDSQRLRKILVAASFFSSLLFVLFQGGKLALMLFFIIAVITCYLFLGKWSGVARVTGRRVFETPIPEGQLEAGATLRMRIDVQIPGIWPIPYLMIRDQLQRENGGTHAFEAFFIPDWYRRGNLSYVTPPLSRGVYRFGRTECLTQDIFGIFEHKGIMDLQSSFSVLPRTVAIREWTQMNRRNQGFQHHSSTSRSNRETTQINGVREYNYGDRLSRIHWNATARTGTLKSKEFERESLPKTLLVLDRCSHHYDHSEQFELAVSVTASMVQFGKNKDIALGMISTGARSFFHDPRRVEYDTARSLLQHLVEVKADGSYSLQRVLEDRIRIIPPGACVIIVSPTRDEALLAVMAWLKSRQLVPCHIWLSSSEEEGRKWTRHLKASGYLGYAIRELDELPQALGGMG